MSAFLASAQVILMPLVQGPYFKKLCTGASHVQNRCIKLSMISPSSFSLYQNHKYALSVHFIDDKVRCKGIKWNGLNYRVGSFKSQLENRLVSAGMN